MPIARMSIPQGTLTDVGRYDTTGTLLLCISPLENVPSGQVVLGKMQRCRDVDPCHEIFLTAEATAGN
jgi:hypothetical protein